VSAAPSWLVGLTLGCVVGGTIGTNLNLGDVRHAVANSHRPSPQCQTAATQAAAVIAHDHVFAGLIDAITAAPISGDRPAIRVGTNLPAFDHRVPNLSVCGGAR